MPQSFERGFLAAALALAIVAVSVGVAGWSLYSFYYNKEIPFAPIQKMAVSYRAKQKQAAPASLSKKAVEEKIIPGTDYIHPHSIYDSVVPDGFNDTVDALMCHYKNKGSYPESLSLIEAGCLGPDGIKFTNPDTGKPFDYEILAGGKGYFLKTNLLTMGEVKGQYFYSTDYDNEFLKRKNDAVRLSDFAVLQQALASVTYGYMLGDNVKTGDLCVNISDKALPCGGSSIKDGRSLDGKGWIKADLQLVPDSVQSGLLALRLAVDPLNDKAHHYTYCATRTEWEMDTVLESQQQKDRMKNDGGDDDNKYEVGTNLKLIDKNGSCRY